jgi:L-cystine uptake protein TcyP (sodium:dicarboxylate symporter family)
MSFGGGIRGIAGVFVAIAITMLIGILVIQGIISNVNQAGWSQAANNTWTSIINNIWAAFGLLVIIPLVVGAVIILRVIGGGRGGEM